MVVVEETTTESSNLGRGFVDAGVETEATAESPNAALFFLGGASVGAIIVAVTDALERSPPHDSLTIVALVYDFIWRLISSRRTFFSSSVI